MTRSTAVLEELKDGSFCITINNGEPEVMRLPDNMGEEQRRHFMRNYMNTRLKEANQKKLAQLHRSIESIDTWVELRKLSKRKTEDVDPPRLAEAAFAWLAPKVTVDAQLGDLKELYVKNATHHGQKRARWLYWLEVLRAIAPALLRLAKKVGIFGIVADYIRAKLGL